VNRHNILGDYKIKATVRAVGFGELHFKPAHYTLAVEYMITWSLPDLGGRLELLKANYTPSGMCLIVLTIFKWHFMEKPI
jgi:hypothetical protein